MSFLLAKADQVLINTQEVMRRFKELVNLSFHKHNFGISYDQWTVLNVLAQKQGVTQIAVALSCHKEPASISRILKLLEKKELIEKIEDRNNKKAKRIYLTPLGGDIQDQAAQLFNQIAKDGFNGIYEQEVNLLVRILDKVHGNFGNMNMRGRAFRSKNNIPSGVNG